jgi:hypothetical protein
VKNAGELLCEGEMESIIIMKVSLSSSRRPTRLARGEKEMGGFRCGSIAVDP